MSNRILMIGLVYFIFSSHLSLSAQEKSNSLQIFHETPIFQNGDGTYNCYRIPAIIKTANGDLLAFAEGRRKNCSDFGDVDIVARRSQDNGRSWSSTEVIAENGSLQSGNPAPVLDLLDPRYPQGRLFLFYNNGHASEHQTRLGQGLRTIHFITSVDHGVTWSSAVDITMQVHRPNRPDLDPQLNFKEDWRSYAITPGHAIQLTMTPYKGRLFIPANHSVGSPKERFDEYRAHAFYSDDHGASWQLSESVEVPSSNESIAVELSDGRVMQNIREQSGRTKNRLVALSDDGGAHWRTTYFDTTLVTPVCQASITSYVFSDGQKMILFSNPASKHKRERMTIRASMDDGMTWPINRLIRKGSSAYSDLVIQADEKIGVLYEHGNNGGIHYANFNMNWLLSGEKRPSIETPKVEK